LLDILRTFSEYTLTLIPRSQNMIVDSLATVANMFKIPVYPNKKYEINVKHRPAVPDNLQHWQVFQDDKQIDNFLQMEEEFANVHIDDQFYEDI
jgi:hypothetical protein